MRLATRDQPGVLCLQELPVWALRRLDDWSGMHAVAAVAAPPRIGPLPSTAGIGRTLTSLNSGLFRSAFSGQANALLIAPALHALEQRTLVLNPWRIRHRAGDRLGLGLTTRLAWGHERRVCQVLRLRSENGTLVLANLHATSFRSDKRLADVELLRAATFVDGWAGPAEPVLLCGDFNLSMRNSRVLPQLLEAEWGFEGATPTGIDHILVRGVSAESPVRWAKERRVVEGRVLSDHAPVERRLA